ncbi:MAG: sigma-54 dependent transcriptional regulator [Desulfuromonadales bacterium]
MINPAASNEAILLFDEQDTFFSGLSMLLHSSGFKRVFAITDSTKIIPFMKETPIAVVIFGLNAPSDSRKTVLREIIQSQPDCSVIVASTLNDRETAVECMKIGVSDFLIHPLDINKLIKSVRSCVESSQAGARNRQTQARLPHETRDVGEVFAPIVTRDRKMLTIFRYIEAIAPTTQAVLITGETGTGKELIARAIHNASGRNGEFVTVNVAGLDDIMFSDTLFGHARGAYTGADRERKGLIEMAGSGTLLLDEIGDLSIASQVKLLRLLQEDEYYPLGLDRKIISTARILVATNSSLESKMGSGTFRPDLFYRLCSHHIHLPALRERINDIPLLVETFSASSAKELGRQLPALSADALDMLIRYEFPGNVRELKGMVSNAVALSTGGSLTFPKLKPRFTPPLLPAAIADFSTLPRSSGRMPTLTEAEEYLIREALRATGGNQRAAAVMLGVSRQALNKRLIRDPSYLKGT